MRYVSVFIAILAFVTVFALPAGAAVTSTGLDPDKVPEVEIPTGTAQVQDCDILWFRSFDESRLTGLGLNITVTGNPADLAYANLQNYDVLVVALTGPGVLGGVQADIEQFVKAGGGFFIHQPNATGTTDYAPTGFDVTIDDIYWCGGGTLDEATIVNAAHPITSGLVDADLSGDFDLVGAIGGGYSSILTENIECGDPALAVGTFGCGRVVFDTGNAGLGAIDPGADQYWLNLFDWLCESELCVYFDIHPTSCPNPLSLKKQGVIPAAILGTEDFDVNDIDFSTLLLEGVAPLRGNYNSDVATPYQGDLCGCTTQGPDGYKDLTLKFAAPMIREALGLLSPGDEVTLTITGNLLDGTPFEAQDCMVIRGRAPSPQISADPTSESPNGSKSTSWGRIKSHYRSSK